MIPTTRSFGIAFLALVIAAATGSARAAALSDEGWTIERFDAQILVRSDAGMVVTESIDVDFGTLQKHGIFRDIPVKYTYGEHTDRVYELRVRSVTDAAGRAWRYERSEEGRLVRIRIGDPDRTISGKQTYRIVYEVAGALNAFADHDELFWNANGEWPARTRTTSAHVQLERGDVTRVACFQGRSGSTEACGATMRAGSADMTATRPLGVGEQVTVVVAFPKGVVAEPKVKLESRPRDIDAWWDLTPASIGSTGLVLLVGIGLVARRWLASGRDPTGRETIVPEYEPPDRLRPAEIGLLVDESADPKDLTATIVDLAVRGYLTIEEILAQGILGRRDWTLRRGRPANDALADYERRLLDGLFAPGDEVKLSALKGTFQGTLASAERDLYGAAVKNGWFPADPSSVRHRWRRGGVGLIVLGVLVAIGLGIFYGAALVGVATAVAGIVALLAGGAMPSRTAAGHELLRRILGFRRYMETAETDRQRFAERENIFAAYLPYAIVFGSVTKWARAFAGLDAQQAVAGWYAGSSFTDIGAFSSDLSSFSSGVSSAISTSPASTGSSSGSSGFDGGGSSGGGGGGGGGGSW